MSTRIIPEAEQLVANEEGEVLYSYDDSVFPTKPYHAGEHIGGTLTGGVGHTGSDVYPDQTITHEQAMTWLEADLSSAEDAVDRIVTVPLNPFQRGAVVSWIFNVGDSSTTEHSGLIKAINANDFAKVPAEFAKWNKTTIKTKDGKKTLVTSGGLTKRRAHEAAFFMSSVIVSASPAPTSSPSAIPAKPQGPAWITPENASGGLTAIAGASAWVSGGGPVQWAFAACLVIGVAVIGTLYVAKRLRPQ